MGHIIASSIAFAPGPALTKVPPTCSMIAAGIARVRLDRHLPARTEDHSVIKREMGVFEYKAGKITPMALFNIGGADYRAMS